MSLQPNIAFLDASTLDAGDFDFSPLRALGTLVIHRTTRPEQTADRLRDADIAVTNKVVVDHAVMQACPRLAMIAVCATGVNNIDLDAARERGIVVSNVAGYSTASVAQHTIALLLSLATSLHRFAAEPNAWAHSPIFTRLDYPVVELAGKSLGIAGLGSIGSAVAGIARALGMNVQALAREDAPTDSGDPVPRLSREEFFRSSDAISLHCPLTPETERLIDASALSLMKPTAFLVNTARGGLVDERALADALRSGAIAGAALDVLSTEPPPPDHPLLDPAIPNLLLSPHSAWISLEARRRLLDGVAANIRNFISGTPGNRVA